MTRPVFIVTLATHRYLPKIRTYLETLNQYALARPKPEHPYARGAYPYLGAVACDPTDTLTGLPFIASFRVPPGMLARSLGNPGNGCVQHGNWLPYLPELPDEAVIICTDGDVRMQRPINSAEWNWLQDWPAGAVGIGPNAHPGDTLNDEAGRIKSLVPIEELARRFYPNPAKPPLCGNAGCIVATKETWVKLWMAYLKLWMETAMLFGHIAVQQWTLNLAIERELTRVVLPGTFHTHGHYGVPAGASGWDTNNATFEGQTVLFAHRCWHQYPPEFHS